MVLLRVLSHPGYGNFKCYIIGKWTCLSFLRLGNFISFCHKINLEMKKQLQSITYGGFEELLKTEPTFKRSSVQDFGTPIGRNGM